MTTKRRSTCMDCVHAAVVGEATGTKSVLCKCKDARHYNRFLSPNAGCSMIEKKGPSA